ncbi:ATP-binding protein [Corynebacterium sp. LK2522]|uniref:HAMP domain-containing sensor histidine kinase n=1 Tax=Corynebacterium sp. LK2522 TaxID=3110474 RepID=UPI0034CEC47F
MIFRKPVSRAQASAPPDEFSDEPTVYTGSSRPWGSRTSLRWRLAILTGLIVAVTSAIICAGSYGAVAACLRAADNEALESHAQAMLVRTQANQDPDYLLNEIEHFKTVHPEAQLTVSPAGDATTYGDDQVPPEDGLSMEQEGDLHTISLRANDGSWVVLTDSRAETENVIDIVGTVLLAVFALGILLAIAGGVWVSQTGLHPIQRLKRAIDHVASTGDLRPISVVGTDDMAQLAVALNRMLDALQESRIKQSQFVADAGHELKTPLTSMRTNIELLMMLNKSNTADSLSEQDRAELEADVLAQMQELSVLIGDLVDLAREDAVDKEMEPVALDKVVVSSLKRARRRRPDVEFQVHLEPWVMVGDPFALGRAVLNLLDNAAKWSPAAAMVRVRLQRLDEHTARLRVDDSGVGIPEAEREKIFERFYRSAEARKMPGSGLGLAIVRQVVERHKGTITVGDSDDHGTRMEIIFPGSAPNTDWDTEDAALNPGETTAGLDGSSASEQRGREFAKRWFNQR